MMFVGVTSLAAGIIVPVLGMGGAGASPATARTNYRFNAVGSDTIYCEDNAVAAAFNAANAPAAKNGNQVDNTPPVLSFNFGCSTSAAKFTVPADKPPAGTGVHGKINYKCTPLDSNLTVALNSGGPAITSLSVGPLNAALQSGKNVTVGQGAGSDTFVTSGAAAQGATSVPIVSAVPANSENVGTGVFAPDCIPGDGASGNLPPDGSGAGIAALIADNGSGNIAYARSSSGRASGNPTSIHYWAFALDAVSWSSFDGANTDAPGGVNGGAANLTQPDIHNIVNCTYTNWNQIVDIPGYTGPNAPIQVWYPQSGSGTGKFFATIFNGGVFPSGSCINSGEENNGLSITQQGSFNADEAFYPYSVAVHQALPGNTGGAALGAVNGVAPVGNISESAANENLTANSCTDPMPPTGFCASRFVYHVTSDALLSAHAAYAKQVLQLVGIKPGTTVSPTKGFCGNQYNAQITANGFVPLGSAATGGQFPTLNSFCREQ
jgi:phosphate transport system substrate-binding protein